MVTFAFQDAMSCHCDCEPRFQELPHCRVFLPVTCYIVRVLRTSQEANRLSDDDRTRSRFDDEDINDDFVILAFLHLLLHNIRSGLKNFHAVVSMFGLRHRRFLD